MERIKRIVKRIPKEVLIILGCAFLLMSFTLFECIFWGHDYAFHASNIFGMDKTIEPTTGTFFPSKIIPTVGYGLGYGTGIFYPPLAHITTSYAYLFTKYIGLNLPQTIELMKFVALFLSGISMYYLVKRISKDRNVSLISAVAYMSAPYFLTDIYIRCALAEVATFIFIPIVFRGLYELFYGKKDLFYIYFIVGYTGMILSHLVITMYLTIFILILLLFKLKELLLDKKILSFMSTSLVILMITSFFYIPMLEHKLLGDYVVFQKNSMANVELMMLRRLSIGDFFSMKPLRVAPVISVGVNIVAFMLAVIALYHNKFWQKKEKKEISIAVCIFIVTSMFFASTLIPWDKLPSILRMIQFPWRLSTFIAFGVSFLAGFSLFQIPKEHHKIATIMFVIALVFFGMNSIPKSDFVYPNLPEKMSVDGMGAQHEYLPVNAAKHEKYLEKRDRKIHIVDGEAETKIKIDRIPNLTFDVKLKSDTVTLELPRIYYLGYDIVFTPKQGKPQKLEYVENKNGLIETEVSESGSVFLKYTGTIANRVSNVISFLSIIGFIGWFVIKKYQKSL